MIHKYKSKMAAVREPRWRTKRGSGESPLTTHPSKHVMKLSVRDLVRRGPGTSLTANHIAPHIPLTLWSHAVTPPALMIYCQQQTAGTVSVCVGLT